MAEKGNLRLIRGEGEPRSNVVELARELLQKAEAGEIIALAAAYEYADRTSSFTITHGAQSSPRVMLGEITLMGHTAAQHMLAGFGEVKR